ncbi:MAG: hypothetical protein JST29_07915 [Bacteroidetes bacterium]|nr:hypothetical protein [Bacteroidota bacterium]MBS1591290.1 hypothetical protein [Bacteroidota bacterium]
MKQTTLIFIILILFLSHIMGQEAYNPIHSNNTKVIIDSLNKCSDGNYIIAFWLKGKVWQKGIRYLHVNNKNILFTSYADSISKMKEVLGESLFSVVAFNLKNLRKAENYSTNLFFSNNSNRFTKIANKEYSDSSAIMHYNLAIKYNNKFNFGHFSKFSEEEIKKAKNKKLIDGMKFVNYLFSVLEEIENK